MEKWLLLGLLLVPAFASPGLQVAVTADPINSLLMQVYAAEVPKLHLSLGDIAQTMHTSLGDIDMKLSNFTVSKVEFDFPTSVVTFQTPNFLVYTVQQLAIHGSAGYDFKMDGIHLTPGNLTLTLLNTNVTLNVSLSAVDKHVQVELADFALDIGSVTVETQLPKEINDLVNHELGEQTATFHSLIQGLIVKELPTLNEKLMSLPDTLDYFPFSLDIGITEGPVVESDYLVLGLNGTVMVEGQAVPAEPAVSVTPGTVLTDGIQAAVTDFLVSSMLRGLWAVLDVNVTSLPASLGLTLDTSGLAILIPQLKKTYGAKQPVYLNVYSTPTDYVEFWTDGNINVNCSANVAFWVYSQSKWQLGATLNLGLSLQVGLGLASNIASVSLNSLTLTQASVVTSNVGPIYVSMLQTMLNAMMKTIALSLNPSLASVVSAKQPIQLPYGLDTYLRTDDVVVKTGYILVGADL